MATRKDIKNELTKLSRSDTPIAASEPDAADTIGARLAAVEHLYAAAVRDVGRYGDELRELRAEFAAARG